MRATSLSVKFGPLLILALLIVATLCVGSNPVKAGTLYKWVDETGQIRYSDNLPAPQVKRKHQQLNSQGIVITTQEAAKSEAELAIELKLEKDAATQAKLDEEQNRKDQVLLLTFSNESELNMARNDRLEVLGSVIQLISNNIALMQLKLDELQARAEETYLSQNKVVPGGLAQRIEDLKKIKEGRDAQLDSKLLAKERIEQQYVIDLNRYRLLKTEAE